MDKSDRELILEAKADPKRFSALYLKYAPKVYNYFWYRLGTESELSQDLTQETFLKAFLRLNHFHDYGYSYLTYLLAIAHNLLANQYRKQKTLSLDAMEGSDEIAAEEKTSVIDREKTEQILHVLQSLNTSDRDLMLLHYHKGLNLREVAHIVHKSENAVKLALSRARKKVRAKIRTGQIKELYHPQPDLKLPIFLKSAGRKNGKIKPDSTS